MCKKVAIHQLASHYRHKFCAQTLVHETEVRVRIGDELGFGRADGLVAVLLSDGTIFTASLEAKSSRTLFNLSPWYDDERWVLHILIAGGIGLLLAGIVGWFIGTWFWMLVFPILTFFCVSFAYILLTHEHDRYQPIDVVRQVKRYPANEQWIAVSSDAYNSLDSKWREALCAACRREGIGLLRVQSAANISFLERPRLRKVPRGRADFLECYSRSSNIRRKLHTLSDEKSAKYNPSCPLSR